MEVKQSKINASFEGYKLCTVSSQLRSNVNVIEKNIDIPPFEPLAEGYPSNPSKSFRKEETNQLILDPFYSDCYYINQQQHIIRINDEAGDMQIQSVFHLNQSDQSTVEPNKALIFLSHSHSLYCNGRGKLVVFDRSNPNQWRKITDHFPFEGENTPFSLLHAQVSTDGMIQCLITMSSKTFQSLQCSKQNPSNYYSTLSIVFKLDEPTPEFILGGNMHPIVYSQNRISYTSSLYDNEVVVFVQGPHSTHTIGSLSEATEREVKVDDHAFYADEMEVDQKTHSRLGVGYKQSRSSTNSSQESLTETNVALNERFIASTKPFSSIEKCESSKVISPNISSGNERPTPTSILNAYEECDQFDESATGVLYIICFTGNQDRLSYQVNCRSFQYLCSSSSIVEKDSSLSSKMMLFQYDVDGLVFQPTKRNRQSDPSICVSHEGTISAFGYVQASKQHKKLMTFHPSGSITVIAEFDKRIYIYSKEEYDAGNPHICKQYIIDTNGEAILGLQIKSESSFVALTPARVLRVTIDKL